jgi:hypothetical protein
MDQQIALQPVQRLVHLVTAEMAHVGMSITLDMTPLLMYRFVVGMVLAIDVMAVTAESILPT